MKIENQNNNQKNKINGIYFEVAGDMLNDGVIQTDKDATVSVNVLGNYTSNKGKIIQGEYKYKKWWIELILGVVIAVVGWVIVYYLEGLIK